MTKAANELLSAAMMLSASERAELAAQLLDTLDPRTPDSGYAQAWEVELLQRIRELDEGIVSEVSWEEAREVIRRGGKDAEAG
jgi:putative addiction module component (TIGR02574 family)